MTGPSDGGLRDRGGELATSGCATGFMGLGPGGLFLRPCIWAAEGLRGRPWFWGVIGFWGLGPVGVIGRLPAGDMARGGPWFMAGDIGRPC